MVTPPEVREDPAAMAEVAVLGTIAIPGRGEQVRRARAFVARLLRELAAPGDMPPGDVLLDNAMLLTSELVTNAIRHSRSGHCGGSVMLAVLREPGSVRVEVTDSGSPDGSPVVKDDVYTCDGHGLFLVEAVADEWGYRRAADAGTTVWFRLDLSAG
jgi:anti-sigma regulatory factor (Ser/Thr protein kinase)